MNFYSRKIIKLKNADVHLHYANNRRRGKNNVTVTIVEIGTVRRPNSKYPDAEYFKQYRVSGWAGNVNVPSDSIKQYGGVDIEADLLSKNKCM